MTSSSSDKQGKANSAVPSRVPDHGRVFRWLLLYRWLALVVPALVLLSSGGAAQEPGRAAGWPLFLLALADNLAPSLFSRPLSSLVLRYPALFAIDLLVAAVLVGASGGVSSPYFLYALTPPLACAFFFGIRGGVLCSLVYSPLYVVAVALGSPRGVELLPSLAGQLLTLAGAAVGFGFLAEMLGRLRASAADLQRARDDLLVKNAHLERANQELRAIQELGAVIRDATTVDRVQEQILSVLTKQFGFERVVVGLVEPDGQAVTSWLAAGVGTDVPALTHTARVSLQGQGNAVSRALAQWKVLHARAEDIPPFPQSLAGYSQGTGEYAALPMICRERPMGIILVDNPRSRRGIPLETIEGLTRLANQAALAISNVQMCVERAQRIAVMSERQRIAADMHDEVIQSLFGMALNLQSCVKLTERDPARVRERLEELNVLAIQALGTVRAAVHELWEGRFDGTTLVAALRRQAEETQRMSGLEVRIRATGEVALVGEAEAKALYRITQEALSNASRHSGAPRASVDLKVTERDIVLTVTDEGTGFDPTTTGPGLGLQTMRERASAVGGQLEVERGELGGTVVRARLLCCEVAV